MKFLQSIIQKSNDVSHKPILRRSHEDFAARKQSAAVEELTPKFSRTAARITRAPVPAASEASLNEILGKWKEDAEPETPTSKPVAEPSDMQEYTTAKVRAKVPLERLPKVERVKTRLLGFDDIATPDPFAKTKPVAETAATRFPVGWLVIMDGPGRGESFTLLTGMSQIGRGQDQAITLDFGDEAISRSNHAAIVYDIESHSFLMGHGGKANVVRVNNMPLITTQALKSGDMIRIGETSLQLVVFSTPSQNWSGLDAAEVANVASA